MEKYYRIEHLTHVGTKFVLTRMQNIIWVANGLAVSYIVEKNAGDLLSRIVKDHHVDKPLVINFKRVTELDDHALDGFFDSLIDSAREVIILEGGNLFQRIDALRKGKAVNMSLLANSNSIMIRKQEFSTITIDEIEREKNEITNSFLKKTISASFEKFPEERRMSSTPLLANGEFNSNKLISDPKIFMWFSTFLADKLETVLNSCPHEKRKLLCASLRGAPFVAATGMLLNIPFDTFDHLGPKHKVFDKEFLNRIEKGTNYVFIGDFSIGGTEIKMAKTYVELKGCFLNNALVIGNYIDKEHFSSEYKLESLIDLKSLGLVNYSI